MKDPLKVLNDMPWAERNAYTERTFVRKTKPSLYDSLTPMRKLALKGLSGALIPFTRNNAPTALSGVLNGIDEDKLWLENIQWCWDVKAGKILIPF